MKMGMQGMQGRPCCFFLKWALTDKYAGCIQEWEGQPGKNDASDGLSSIRTEV